MVGQDRGAADRRDSGTSWDCAWARRSSKLELLPYAVSKSSSLGTTPGDPFNTRGRPTMRVGLDLKNRLTTNLTLDATINPDFGQVEVDPAVLNLSAFETFFPEKRPFFVEGSQVFDFGGFSCNFCSNIEGMSGFYSRRIGRAPTGADSRRTTTPSPTFPTRRRSSARQDHGPHGERIHRRACSTR